MKVLLLTVGTRGDVQPFIALGRGLMRAGHDVTLCTHSSFEPAVEAQGLHYAYLNSELIAFTNAEAGREAIENAGGGIVAKMKWTVEAARLFKPIFRRMLAEEWEAAQGAEIIIYHPQAVGGYHIAEALGVPGIMADPLPMYVPTGAFPNLALPDLGLGGWYNRLTYRLLPIGLRAMYGQVVQGWRKETLKLASQPFFASGLKQSGGQPVPVMHGFSRHIVPKPVDWPESAVVTGYWFLDEGRDWKPPDEMAEFLEAGSPPVFAGFGSMSGRDPAKTGRIVLDALARSGQRGIIVTGWGGMQVPNSTERAFVTEGVPYDWLMPRVSMVIHHGGAGTTAAGLRAGKPTVICPFVADQPFWGNRVAALGVGPEPIPQRKLTVENLATAIQKNISNAQVRTRAEELGQKIRSEDGVANAVRFIESYFSRQVRRRPV